MGSKTSAPGLGFYTLSLHDDIESIDPETSGCRQRLGWRPQNTAVAFETWPNYRGSSANASRRSMSQQFSHRDDFYHPERESLGQRWSSEWWISPAAGSQTRGRGTLPNQRGTNVYRRGTHANQRGTHGNQRGTNANQRGTNAYQRGTNANQRGTNAYQRGTNANQRGTNAYQRGTNANQRGTNAYQRGTNANQRGTNAYQRGTNANQRGTNASQRGIPVNQRGTQTSPRREPANRGRSSSNQRGTLPNQRETETSQRGLPTTRGSISSSRRGVPVSRGGSSLNRRGIPANRGRTSSNQRGTKVNRGRSPLKRKTPGKQRESSSPRPPHRDKLKPLKSRHPKVLDKSFKRGSSPSNLPLGQAIDQNLARQQETSADQHGTPGDQHESLVDQFGTPGDQQEFPADQRRTPGDQLETPADQRRTPGDQQETPADQRRTPGDQLEISADQRRTPGDQHETSSDHRGTSGNQRESSADQQETIEKKRLTSADQYETSHLEQPPLSDTKILDPKNASWRWTGSSPKVRWAEEEPPRRSPLKEWLSSLLWWWPRKRSAAPIKSNLKAAKDERKTSMSKQETEKGQFDIPAPLMLENEKLTKGETDAEGLDPESLMFRDGLRRIDMVIAYRDQIGVMTAAEETRREHRSFYQENLIKEGLELELEHESLSFNGKTWFLKIHIPWETQLRIAKIIGLELPTKNFISVSVRTLSNRKVEYYQKRWYVRVRQRFNKIFDLTHIKPEPSFYMANKNSRREEQFLIRERDTEFSPAQRSLLVMQILLRAKYSNETNQFGIRRLLAAGTYITCYPLHEGEYFKSRPNGTYTDRQLLYLEWARPCNWYKPQPLWLVRRYFGDQIGLYYVWLGFYTKMLIPPAAVGTMSFLYGIMSDNSGDNIPSKEICDVNGPGNITLCPLCDKACSYQKLSESCIFAQLTYFIDNPATVLFAIFMSFWATTFMLLWQREQSVIHWQWGLSGTDLDENPRPEYEAAARTTRVNPVTKEREPFMSTWQSFVRRVAISSAMFMMLAVSLASVVGVITYRISMVAVIYSGSGGYLRKYARLFTILTAAIINLTVSELLIKIFTQVAMVLTNLENPRTRTDYENSYTFKMFIFESVNFYSTLVYIAFFKGAFFDHPGDKEARKSPILRIKGDICFHSGCLSELCIMLAVSMIGKQTLHNIKEMAVPAILNWWRYRSHRANTLDLNRPSMPWEQDYHIQDPGHMALYEEYLEMIMQYGCVTLFVAAFPLAPLCALINNICEIRLDAYKMVVQARRPLAERAEDIGVWHGVLRLITYGTVVSNAFVIAYASDFIPRMVYKYVYSPEGSLEGYVNYSLSWFNTSDFQAEWGADDAEWDPPQCAYRGYRNPPNHPDPYGLSPYYWHVFAARLSFVVVFEHVVFSLTQVIHSFIATVPSELVRQMRREALLEKELKYGRTQPSSGTLAYLTSESDGKGLKELKSDADVTLNWKNEA